MAKQANKVFRARQMHVGVKDCRGVGLDGDDHNVRVGFSDVVLDCQPTGGARCRRSQSRMFELEFLCRRYPAHERFDRGAVVRQQRVGLRARDCFFRMRSREPIERLMQLHDQTMQAVAAGLGKSG